MANDDLIERLSEQADRIDSCGQRYSLSAHLMRRAAVALHEGEERLSNMADVAMAKQVRTIELGAEIEALNLEVMAHQVGDGYDKGYEHGSLTATKFAAERDVLAARVEQLEAAIREHEQRVRDFTPGDHPHRALWAALEAEPVPEPRPATDEQPDFYVTPCFSCRLSPHVGQCPEPPAERPKSIARNGPCVRACDGFYQSFIDGNYIADHATESEAWAALGYSHSPPSSPKETR